jgi:hypothetical protein
MNPAVARRAGALSIWTLILVSLVVLGGLLPVGPGAHAAPAGLPAGMLPSGWLTMNVDGTRLHYHPADGPLATGLARVAPAVRARVARAVGTNPYAPVDVVLLPRRRGDAAGAHVPSAPDWAAGFTVPGSGVLFIRVSALGVYPDRDVASIFAHELGHAELGRAAGATRLPRWFEEGACMVLARPWDLRDSWSLTLAVLFHDSAEVLQHGHAFPQEGGAARAAYAQSFSFVEWLARRKDGAASLGRVAQRVGGGRPFVSAFALEYGMTPQGAVEVWRRSMGRWYRTVSVITSTTALWIGILALLLAVAMGQRRRRRRILARWELEELRAQRLDPDEIEDPSMGPH